MKTCLAIRHVGFEDLGTLEIVLRQHGYDVRYLEAGRDHLAVSAAGTDDLCAVLGGPIGAYEANEYPFISDELRFLEKRISLLRPTLGVCLGAQLMAKAMGAEVYPCGIKEIGWSEITLTDTGRASPLSALEEVPVLHWHGDVFDLPSGATNLASTSIAPHQAFSLGAEVLALQFHAELDSEEFESWLIGHAVEIAGAGLSPRTLREQTLKHGSGLRHAARRLFTAWLEGLSGEGSDQRDFQVKEMSK